VPRGKIILVLAYSCYVLLIWLLRENIEVALLVSMPLREMYSPSIGGILLFYVTPLLLGYLGGKALREKEAHPPVLAVLFLPLFLSLLFMLPVLIVFLDEIKADSYLFITLGYSFMLIPMIFVVGSLTNFLGSEWHIAEERQTDVESWVRKYAPCLFLALLVALLNTIPLLLSQYPVGNDVWSHAALSERIAQGESLFQDPFFYERATYYPPLVHFLIAKTSQVTHIGVLDLWRAYMIPLSAIFILLLFHLSLKLTKNHNSAFLATLFIFPWFSHLWMDPSPRLFSLCLLLLMLIFCLKGLKGNRKFFLLGGISFVGILLSHLEIAAHAVIILIVMLVLAKYRSVIERVFSFLARKTRRIRLRFTLGLGEMVALRRFERGFWVTLLVYVSIVLYFIIFGTTYHFDKLFTLSEIGLSLVMPMGSLSFIVFLFGLPALLPAVKHKAAENTVLLSVAFLYTSVFFCFTHLWQFYHRYFAEVACIAIAILAAAMISRIMMNNKRVGIAIIASVALLLFASVIPRLDNILDYAPATQDTVESKIGMLRDIEELDQNAVILANPNDIVNRYIPAIAGKYIFCGRAQISQQQQWAVISDHAVTALEKKDTQKRFDLGERFFEDPGILDEIRNDYRITHILVTEQECSTLDLENDDRLNMISKNDGYVLLEIRGEGTTSAT